MEVQGTIYAIGPVQEVSEKFRKQEIIERIELCRAWLQKYDAEIQARIGTRIITL